MKEARSSTKNGLRGKESTFAMQSDHDRAYSSPRKNSVVRARCSRDKLVESTPPYSSLSRTVPSADRVEVLCMSTTFQYKSKNHKLGVSDLERKVLKRMSYTRFILESTACFYEKCDRRSWLAIVHSSNFDPGSVYNCSKAACYTGRIAGRRPSCQHRF